MNFKIIYVILFLNSTLFSLAQKDKIIITATLDTLSKTLAVNQKIFFYNDTKTSLNSIYFHSATNSYSNNHTELGKRKLEDRNKVLYFSKLKERGKIEDLTIFTQNKPALFLLRDFEFYEIYLYEPLLPDKTITIELNYKIKLPVDKISGYGYFKDGSYLLKYFFLQPLSYKENKPLLVPFTDTEFSPYRNTDYEINLQYPDNYFIDSDLKVIDSNNLMGTSKDAISILISKKNNIKFNYKIKEDSVEVSIGYGIKDSLLNIYQNKIERELSYLHKKLGPLPSKIFISTKIKKNQNFIGVDDINFFGIKEWNLFSEEDQIDLKLFQQIAYNVINQKIELDKNLNHWILNGLLFYYQYNYIKEFYPNTKLLGNLPNEVSVFKIKPLKYFFISKVPLTDRYKLGYRYIATQNYDQPINEKYLNLSNINQIIISGFKTGLSFNFISDYIGKNIFEESIKTIVQQNKDKELTSEELKNSLEKSSKRNLDWFFNDYINTNERINFKIKKFYSQENQDSIQINIYNKTQLPVPILISAKKDKKIVNEKWVYSTKKDSLYSFPKGNYDELLINKNYLFPEINDNDNSLITKGFYKNKKRFQLKFYADVDNPNYTQIFYEPKVKWNNYDKFILGIRFYNRSPFSRPFEYSFAPTYSTGTNSLTGSGSLNYNIDMETGIFRRISLNSNYNYFHYDKGLSYTQYSEGLSFIFKKRPRSEISRTISVGFNSVEREKDPFKLREKNDYSHYNLLNISYIYSDKKIINEWYGRTDFQHSNLFDKISSEIYYRHEYAYNKKITLRYFGGYFFNNRSNSTYFDFGIDHITDYSFSYVDYLGRSATSGLLYQQYIMAEGGFKSLVDKSASKWINTLNGEIHLWKLFDLYADAGVYKSNGKSIRFIYDSGVKLRIIPDFLELYFPMQSTLGFEPAMKNYFSNIRFTFNFNLSAVINHLRRGWY